MELSWEMLASIQFGVALFMLCTYEHGVRDRFNYGLRTVVVVAYSVVMFGDNRAYGTILDWLVQTMCLCHYISILANVFNPTLRFRKKDA